MKNLLPFVIYYMGHRNIIIFWSFSLRGVNKPLINQVIRIVYHNSDIHYVGCIICRALYFCSMTFRQNEWVWIFKIHGIKQIRYKTLLCLNGILWNIEEHPFQYINSIFNISRAMYTCYIIGCSEWFKRKICSRDLCQWDQVLNESVEFWDNSLVVILWSVYLFSDLATRPYNG